MMKEQNGVFQEEGEIEARGKLYQLVGLRRVKEEITRMSELAEFVRMRRENGFSDPFPVINMLFMGHPGTGKHTVARIVGEIFSHLGMLSDGTVHVYRRENFVHSGYALNDQPLRLALEESKGGVFLLEEAEELYPSGDPNDPMNQFWNLLFRFLDEAPADLLVIISGDSEGIQNITSEFPDMQRYFPVQLFFEDYSVEELLEIAQQMLQEKQFVFAPGAADKFQKLLKAWAPQADFTNGHFVADCLDDATNRMAKRLLSGRTSGYTKEEMMTIRMEDIVTPEFPDPKESLDRFNRLIGLQQLKNNMMSYVHYIYFIQERQQHGFMDVLPPLNAIFAGNPGTGKITVARMLGEILEEVGVLDSPRVTVCGRGELLGDGSIPIQQWILYVYEQARGGILYLKDVQELFQDHAGAAALGGLFGLLSDTEQGDTIVILSGDPEVLKKVMGMNPKLKKVFPYCFHFEDYTPEELLAIALQKAAEKNYVFHPKAKEALGELIHKVYHVRDKYFSNALFVEKLIDKAIHALSSRLMEVRKNRELTRKEVTTLMAADIPVISLEKPLAYKEQFDEKEITAALKELNHMVGQQKMKKQIHDFVDLARHYHQQGIKLNTRLSLQWCFTGNSGMGKGTVARIIARLYKAMGILEKKQVYTFRVERLINLTEEEALRALGSALSESKGGLFFFDEDSNTLNQIPGLKERARAMLANQLSVMPGGYTVIYARQDPPRILLNDEVERVADMMNILVFENYTKEELLEILKRDLVSENYRLTRTAQRHVADFIAHLVENQKRNQVSARLVKLLAEMMIRNRIQRLAKQHLPEGEKIHSITMQDVKSFTPELLENLTTAKNTIGFKM